MNRFEEVEIRVTRALLDVSTFGGPVKYDLDRPRTRGVATGDLQQLAIWYRLETPIDLSELDSRLSGRALFVEQPHGIGATNERRGRQGVPQQVVGRGKFVVEGVALVEGGEAQEGTTILKPGRPIVHRP